MCVSFFHRTTFSLQTINNVTPNFLRASAFPLDSCCFITIRICWQPAASHSQSGHCADHGCGHASHTGAACHWPTVKFLIWILNLLKQIIELRWTKELLPNTNKTCVWSLFMIKLLPVTHVVRFILKVFFLSLNRLKLSGSQNQQLPFNLQHQAPNRSLSTIVRIPTFSVRF